MSEAFVPSTMRILVEMLNIIAEAASSVISVLPIHFAPDHAASVGFIRPVENDDEAESSVPRLSVVLTCQK